MTRTFHVQLLLAATTKKRPVTTSKYNPTALPPTSHAELAFEKGTGLGGSVGGVEGRGLIVLRVENPARKRTRGPFTTLPLSWISLVMKEERRRNQKQTPSTWRKMGWCKFKKRERNVKTAM